MDVAFEFLPVQPGSGRGPGFRRGLVVAAEQASYGVLVSLSSENASMQLLTEFEWFVSNR